MLRPDHREQLVIDHVGRLAQAELKTDDPDPTWLVKSTIPLTLSFLMTGWQSTDVHGS